MPARPDPTLDPSRLRVLEQLRIVGTAPEALYDDIATLAAALLRADTGAVNVVERDRHWTKAAAGPGAAPGASVDNEVSLCAATVRSADGLLCIPDAKADAAWRGHPLVEGDPHVGFYAGASIEVAGRPVGVVCAYSAEPRDVSPGELRGLEALARQAAAHLELRRASQELQRIATTDPLTGLANRVLLLDRLELALARRARHGGEVAVAFCDVDAFKSINDRFGHETGDRVLRELAEELRACVRQEDTVGRLAGDELVIVCPDLQHEDDAEQLAARLAAIEGRVALPTPGEHARVSAGIVLAADGETAADVLARADAAMYAVKRVRRS